MTMTTLTVRTTTLKMTFHRTKADDDDVDERHGGKNDTTDDESDDERDRIKD